MDILKTPIIRSRGGAHGESTHEILVIASGYAVVRARLSIDRSTDHYTLLPYPYPDDPGQWLYDIDSEYLDKNMVCFFALAENESHSDVIDEMMIWGAFRRLGLSKYEVVSSDQFPAMIRAITKRKGVSVSINASDGVVRTEVAKGDERICFEAGDDTEDSNSAMRAAIIKMMLGDWLLEGE